mgnify:CR=1 FL=1
MVSNSRLETIIKDSHKNKCSALKIKLISGDEYIIFIRQIRLINDYVTLNYGQIRNDKTSVDISDGYYDSYYTTSGKTQFKNIVNNLEATSKEYSIDILEIFKEFVEHAYKNDKIFWKELDKTIVESLDNDILSMNNTYNESLENIGTVYIDDNNIVSVTCIDSKLDKMIYTEYSDIIDLVNRQKIA